MKGETNKLNLEHSQLPHSPPPYTPVSLAFLLLTDDRQTDWGRGEGGTIVVKMFMWFSWLMQYIVHRREKRHPTKSEKFPVYGMENGNFTVYDT